MLCFFAGKAAGEALSNTVLFNNPIAGVMLGVMATVLVQSSSTSTSIVVSMVSAGRKILLCLSDLTILLLIYNGYVIFT